MVPLTIDFANLHTILGTLYEDMLPLCKDMMDVGKGLAGNICLFIQTNHSRNGIQVFDQH